MTNITSPPSHGIRGTDMIRIHDVYPAFVQLDVDGIAEYHTRAATLTGIVAIQSPLPSGWTRLLRDTNIGAQELWRLPQSSTLTEALGEGHLRLVQQFVDHGGKLEFFLPTTDQRKFVESKLGLDYTQSVWGPDPDLAALTNQKIWMHRQFQEYFPEHTIVDQADQLAVAEYCHYLIDKYGGAIVKADGLASGDGMIKLHPGPNWVQRLSQGLRKFAERGFTGEVIVEAAYWDHTPLSAQFEVSDSGPQFILDTEQVMVGHTVHAGNTITNGSNPEVGMEARQLMIDQSIKLGWEYWKLGYRGHLGFDGMDTGHGLFMNESNARITGAMYPLSIGLQMQANGVANWAVVTRNIEPAHRWSYDRLHQTLTEAGLLYGGRRGVLPMAPGLLTIDDGKRKAMVYCFGQDVTEANGYLDEVESLLRPTND